MTVIANYVDKHVNIVGYVWAEGLHKCLAVCVFQDGSVQTIGLDQLQNVRVLFE